MFITLEGIEGSGKSTMQKRLAEHLQAQGYDVLCTREPGGAPLGKTLRTVLLDMRTNIHSRAELFLFLADRAQHVHEVIRPALAAGRIVLCDRYIDSTLAYQGYGRGLDRDELLQLNTLATDALWPQLTLLFDVPVETGLFRASSRNNAENTTITEGRFEAEHTAFHERVRAGYHARMHEDPQRFVCIDSTMPMDAVFQASLSAIMAQLDDK